MPILDEQTLGCVLDRLAWWPLCLLVMAGCAWIFVRPKARALRLERQGVRTQGVLVRLEDGEGHVDDVLHYRFTLPDGTVMQERWTRHGLGYLGHELKPGDRLDIVYLDEDPRQNQPRGRGSTRFDFALAWLPALMLGLLFLLFLGDGVRDATCKRPRPPEPARQLGP